MTENTALYKATDKLITIQEFKQCSIIFFLNVKYCCTITTIQ